MLKGTELMVARPRVLDHLGDYVKHEPMGAFSGLSERAWDLFHTVMGGHEDTPSGVGYGGGSEPRATHIPLIDQIKTYNEQIDDPEELNTTRDCVAWAEQIVFLGFAFHDQNLRLLKPEQKMKAKDIFGTTYGMSDSDAEIIKGQLLQFFQESQMFVMRKTNRIVLRSDLTCSGLFDQYTKTLPG